MAESLNGQEDFFMFLHILVYVKHVTPGASHFWPQGHNLDKLVRSPHGDATYHISKLKALWFQRIRLFYVSPYISLCKACDP